MRTLWTLNPGESHQTPALSSNPPALCQGSTSNRSQTESVAKRCWNCAATKHVYGIFMCLLKSFQSPFTITQFFSNKMEKFSERQSPVVSSKQLPYWWIEAPLAHLLEHQYHYSCSKHQTKPPAPWIDSPTSALSEFHTNSKKKTPKPCYRRFRGELMEAGKRLKPIEACETWTLPSWTTNGVEFLPFEKSGHVFVVKRLAQRRDLS